MVNWTASARSDLKNIHDYIATESIYYARKAVSSIITRADILDSFTQMGRMIPEIMDPSIRELIVPPYRIMYETTSDGVKILAVIHGKRDFDETFDIT
jgi:toxin ParE1/3/4